MTPDDRQAWEDDERVPSDFTGVAWSDHERDLAAEVLQLQRQLDEARAEVERMRGEVAYGGKAIIEAAKTLDDYLLRAEAAEARVKAVEGLADEWAAKGITSVYESAAELAVIVRETLASVPAPTDEAGEPPSFAQIARDGEAWVAAADDDEAGV